MLMLTCYQLVPFFTGWVGLAVGRGPLPFFVVGVVLGMGRGAGLLDWPDV